MPIHKNITLWGTDNVTLLEFGKADINIADSKGETYTAVLFKNEQGEFIGAETEKYKGQTSTEYAPDVVMFFDNTESIDVVIEKLQLAKEQLLSLTPEN